MRIKVNGQDRLEPKELTLEQLVATVTTAPRGIAAAVNENVVPRSHWSRTGLGEGDRVEILSAVQGG